jgi:hypothetical protein
VQAWAVLYSVTGASAATLLGLLFVSVSIHSGATDGLHQNSRLMAEQAFQNYLVVVLVSLLALFPTLSLEALGYCVLGITTLRAVYALVRLYRATLQPFGANSRSRTLRQQIVPLIGFGLLIYAAACMARGWSEQRTTFAVAIVLLLASATTVAWELLLRILAEKRA